MMFGIPVFTAWWEMGLFLLAGLILAIIGIILSPIFLTIRFIEYIRNT